MPAPALLPENNILGLGAAIAAVLLSVFSLRRTAQIADRQYALSYMQDVTKWAGEVVEEFQRTHACLRSQGPDVVSRRAQLYGHADVLSGKYHQGRFLLSDPEDGMPGEDVLVQIRDYYHALECEAAALASAGPLDDAPFRAMRETFIERLECIVPSRVRSESARRLIRKESLEFRAPDTLVAAAPPSLRPWRWLFMVAAGFNLVVGAALITAAGAVYAAVGWTAPPMLEIQLTGWLVFVFGLGYALVAGDPTRHHGIVRIAVIGKLGAVAIIVAHWLAGTAPPVFAAAVLGDLGLGIAFLYFLGHARRS